MSAPGRGLLEVLTRSADAGRGERRRGSLEQDKESGSMADLYQDRWIICSEDEIRVRWYYLWGAKRITYRSIRRLKRVQLTLIRGKARIWGTANPRYWASLDPTRSTKQTAFILDLGRFVHPFLTPDDP